MREVIGTKFGTVWTIAAACWVAFGALSLVVLGRSRRRRLLGLLVAPMAYLALVPALAGHASTQSPVAVMFSANALHVAAMILWLGGLVALLFAVPVATRQLAPPERSALLAAVLVRFSAIALAAVGALLVTGLVQAYIEIRHLDLVLLDSLRPRGLHQARPARRAHRPRRAQSPPPRPGAAGGGRGEDAHPARPAWRCAAPCAPRSR